MEGWRRWWAGVLRLLREREMERELPGRILVQCHHDEVVGVQKSRRVACLTNHYSPVRDSSLC